MAGKEGFMGGKGLQSRKEAALYIISRDVTTKAHQEKMATKSEAQPPIGYIRAHKQHDIPTGSISFTYTKWNGTEWEAYVPVDLREEQQILVGKTNGENEVVNSY